MKNLCGKTRKVENPYEIWTSPDGTWTWKVLKKYKTDEASLKDPYSRWFCSVTSPMCTYGELGDVYVNEIMAQATLTERDPEIAVALLFKK